MEKLSSWSRGCLGQSLTTRQTNISLVCWFSLNKSKGTDEAWIIAWRRVVLVGSLLLISFIIAWRLPLQVLFSAARYF
ncbi:hypothetical protein PVAP13_8KG008056 [Panicum virgatum]|uniref:Uncharacterized protein n=1 Tax=Panicum virgatum TaxID=38727 RepID=A0A8T0PFZ8_PANVG|nr:hypothetical protein PVAP13_8KG008056 [Panicum virgatum]